MKRFRILHEKILWQTWYVYCYWFVLANYIRYAYTVEKIRERARTGAIAVRSAADGLN